MDRRGKARKRVSIRFNRRDRAYHYHKSPYGRAIAINNSSGTSPRWKNPSNTVSNEFHSYSLRRPFPSGVRVSSPAGIWKKGGAQRRNGIRIAFRWWGILDVVQRSPNGHVEDVAANRARHGHVAESFPRDYHAGDQIWDAGAGGEERQAHHFRWNANRVAGDIRPPDHQVRVSRDPKDRADERHREELLSCNKQTG